MCKCVVCGDFISREAFAMLDGACNECYGELDRDPDPRWADEFNHEAYMDLADEWVEF